MSKKKIILLIIFLFISISICVVRFVLPERTDSYGESNSSYEKSSMLYDNEVIELYVQLDKSINLLNKSKISEKDLDVISKTPYDITVKEYDMFLQQSYLKDANKEILYTTENLATTSLYFVLSKKDSHYSSELDSVQKKVDDLYRFRKSLITSFKNSTDNSLTIDGIRAVNTGIDDCIFKLNQKKDFLQPLKDDAMKRTINTFKDSSQ